MISNFQAPLAELLRPKTLCEVVGQDHLLAKDQPLGRMMSLEKVSSMILCGPPGCGKTTIARLLTQSSQDNHFVSISAVFSGVSDLKKIFEESRVRKSTGGNTVLFVDEIHRFNKSQQDSFLSVIEDGTIILIGATTENPSFELNKALLSRCQIFTLKDLDESSLNLLFEKAQAFFQTTISITKEAKQHLSVMCAGDGRFYLNMLEMLFGLGQEIDIPLIESVLQKRAPLYDKGGDQHYNLISILHKSMRASDVNAALYWLGRMLGGGEDPSYILRRLIRFAIEDIGMADPAALGVILNLHKAYEVLGSPEGDLGLYQGVIYLATAPKSNSTYVSQKKVLALQAKNYPPPEYALNYSKNYIYDHDLNDAFSGVNYFPKELDRMELYVPVQRGFEREIVKRLEYWKNLRKEKTK